MKSAKILLILLFSLFSLFGNSQNITQGDSLVIKIVMRNHQLAITYGDNISSILTSTISYYETFEKVRQTKPLDQIHTQALIDTLSAYDILNIPDDNYKGIDGTDYVFEIITPIGKRQFSYWSPWSESYSDNSLNRKKVATLIERIGTIIDLDNYEKSWLESLEPGIYNWGLTSISIDRFLPEHVEKSTLYEYVVNRMNSEMEINKESSHLIFPSIVINSKRAFLNDLNKYKLKKVKEVSVIKANDSKISLYGASGANGVIVVQTK